MCRGVGPTPDGGGEATRRRRDDDREAFLGFVQQGCRLGAQRGVAPEFCHSVSVLARLGKRVGIGRAYRERKGSETATERHDPRFLPVIEGGAWAGAYMYPPL